MKEKRDSIHEMIEYASESKMEPVQEVFVDSCMKIVYNSAREIVALDSDGGIIWKKLFTSPSGINVLDVTGDFIPEIIVHYNDDNRMGVQVLDGKGQELANHEFYSRWYSEPPPKDKWSILWNLEDFMLSSIPLLKKNGTIL